MKKILYILFLLPVSSNSQTTIDTTIDGWNAVIYRPAQYYVNGNSDSALHCFVFSYGASETGASYTTMRTIGGPIAYIVGGGAASVTVGSVTHYPIYIGLRIPVAFPTNGEPLAKLDAIRTAFKIKKKNLHVGGFSAGGYAYKIMATEDAYDNTVPYGPFTYADAFKSIIDVQGPLPDDNSDWFNKIKNFARNNVTNGGIYAGWWGTGDGDRSIPRLADSMNAVVSNSAFVNVTSDAHGYNPAVHRVYGYPDGTAPQTFTLAGRTQTAYQWAIRNGDSTLPNISPIAQAGIDQRFESRNYTWLYGGRSTDADGSISSYQWVKISGSGSDIISPTAAATRVSNLSPGTYQFELTVTDNGGATDKDTLSVIIFQRVCNVAAPVVHTLTYTDANYKEYYNPSGSGLNFKGGDTVKIDKDFSLIAIGNITGDSCKPLVFIDDGNNRRIKRLRFGESHKVAFIKVTATQQGRLKIGTNHLAGGNISLAFALAHNIEVSNLYLDSCEVGISAKFNPTAVDSMQYPNFILKDIYLHHNILYDIHGEGMYIGHTYPNSDPYSGNLIPVRMDNVEIAYNDVSGTDWDGIQLSNAMDNASIHHNTIRNFGRIDMGSQRAGIILGGNTNGRVYNNTVRYGTGNGIQIFGYGDNDVYNNIIDSAGRTLDGANGEQSIYSHDPLITIESRPPTKVEVYNNLIRHHEVIAAIQISENNNNADPSWISGNWFCFFPSTPGSWETTMIGRPSGSTVTGNSVNCSATNYPGAPGQIRGMKIKLKINF